MSAGSTKLVHVPVPSVGPGQLLVRTTSSLVSAGTERMLVDFGKANWIDKARQQPEKFQDVIDKARTDGLLNTFLQSKPSSILPCLWGIAMLVLL